MPANNSPFWPILRLAVVAVVATFAVSKGYAEGWVTRADLPVVGGIVASLLGVDIFQKISNRK